MTVIAIANQKGGVAKTTITLNLAHILAKSRQANVLVIDNDPQGNLTGSFIKELPKKEAHGSLVFKNRINKRVQVEESPTIQQGMIQYAPKSAAGKAFQAAARELKRRIKSTNE